MTARIVLVVLGIAACRDDAKPRPSPAASPVAAVTPDARREAPDAATSDGTSPPDDGSTTPDAPPPVCSQYGQICTVDSDCCNAIPCTAGICRIPPM